MSLCEEVPQKPSDAVVFSRIKQEEHDEIDRLTSEFIAMGGAIKQIPPGVAQPLDKSENSTNSFGDL